MCVPAQISVVVFKILSTTYCRVCPHSYWDKIRMRVPLCMATTVWNSHCKNKQVLFFMVAFFGFSCQTVFSIDSIIIATNIRSIVMAAVEVYIVLTTCHSTANFVGAVPNHLIQKNKKQRTKKQQMHLRYTVHKITLP